MALADALALPLAQTGDGFVRDAEDPSTECVANNDSICFGWIAENFDRYTGPALEHLVMVPAMIAVMLVHRAEYSRPVQAQVLA